MFKLGKTREEKSAEAARSALAKRYEDEVLLPAASGQVSIEEAEAAFFEKLDENHRAVLIELFGRTPRAAGNIDPYEIG